MSEPRLTDEDLNIWRMWRMECLAWARSSMHRRRVERAASTIRQMAASNPGAYVGWSAGKDSTALAHLVCVECEVPARCMAIKDDLDFPGERAYIERLSGKWGVETDVITPAFGLLDYLLEHADTIEAAQDLHGRASEFADTAFYGLIDKYRRAAGMPGVYLGLRADESRGRQLNFWTRGDTYTKKDGETVCQPLATWEGRDVYAYLFSRDIPLLDVYRCVRMHKSPDKVRKSWWLPGAHSRQGGMVWLRTYYPSLYGRLVEVLPDAAAWS